MLGALFINIVQNGMNLGHIESSLQTVVIGVVLILAVVADQVRLRYISVVRRPSSVVRRPSSVVRRP